MVSPLAARPMYRKAGTFMIWLFGLAQLWVISLLVHFLLDNKVTNNGTDLIHIAARVEGTTIVIAAFAFWLVDSGGPIARQEGLPNPPDFMWSQTENPQFAAPGWAPSFLDYLFVAFTNGVAFSPTDTMPLSDAHEDGDDGRGGRQRDHADPRRRAGGEHPQRLARSSSATASTCGVCGNMSTGRTRSRR